MLIISLLCVCIQLKSQTVGLVLSGGGAKGYAHVGVIKALEEHNIPIDYITGTSMGAIVGGLYAAGYSPDEMIEIFKGEKFNNYYKGDIPERFIDFFKYEQPDGALISVDFRLKRNKISLALPTNMIATQPMDFGLIELFAQSSAAANSNFDSLFVPFRCIASDVHQNKEKVFSEGDLGTAIRASMTFPLAFKPVDIDGTLYFDGGIYNNFPIETMQEVFHPDIIIGVSVTSILDRDSPDPDDIVGQVESLVMGEQKNIELDENMGFILNFKLNDVGIMDFAKVTTVSEIGYNGCNRSIDSILNLISRKKTAEELKKERAEYKKSLPDLNFDNIAISGKKLKISEKKYVEEAINVERLKSKYSTKTLNFQQIESAYYKLISDYQVDMATPRAKYNDSTKNFDLLLNVKKENRATVSLGAGVSSGSSSYGFIGATYKLLDRVSAIFKSNFYFGKFYTSFHIGGRLDVPTYQPVALDISANFNRLDYFKGSSRVISMTYQPPYIVDYENNVRFDFITPTGRHSIAKLGMAFGTQRYSYFQVNSYQQTDTADITNFKYSTSHLSYEHNTLNYPMYPNDGSNFVVDLRHTMGTETNVPGSTTNWTDTYKKRHGWLLCNIYFDSYTKVTKHITFGIFAQLYISSKSLFRNYSSSILSAYAFSPIPNSKTIFLSNYRADNFIAWGIKPIIRLTNRLNFRLEGYFYMPYKKILKEELSQNIYTPLYAEKLTFKYFMASASLVYNTRLGPLGFSVNYMDSDNLKWYFMFHLGFIIFNKTGFDY